MGTKAGEKQENVTHVCWEVLKKNKEEDILFIYLFFQQGCEKTLPNSIISVRLNKRILFFIFINVGRNFITKNKIYKQTITR